ncbi:MAG: hypothetical protein IH904_05730 [Proteobacteria bacterium]|nr:hypothetical protein [Pseudomonadota bacterium]
MTDAAEKDRDPGVYARGLDGEERLVHLYQGGLYDLGDIAEIFSLGTPEDGENEGETVLVLNRKDLRTLKTMADAYSFDYEEPFIEMCLEMHRFALEVSGETVRFTANFPGELD